MIELKRCLCCLFLFLTFHGASSQDSLDVNIPVTGSTVQHEIVLSTRQDVKEFKKIMLEWSCSKLTTEQFFTIERSKNGSDFDVIAVLKGNKGQSLFEFTDEMPTAVTNFYRIKTTFPGAQPVYSKIISRGVSIARFCKFYPNPVEKYLIVRTESPVELKITDPLNKVRISKQLDVGLQLVDVNSLEKGLYIITLFQKDSNRLITDKLIKN